MENNKKNINCIINSKQIKIRNYITFSAFCVYEEFNQDKNVTYRDLFCRIIYSNVLSEDEKKVDIEEIMNLSHKELIGIGYEIVNNDEKLKIHFNSLVEEDFFTKFILSCDLYSQQIKEGMKEFLTLFVGKIQPLEGVSEKLGKVLNKELGEVLSRTGKLVAGVYEAVSKIGMQIYSFIEAAKIQMTYLLGILR